MIMVVRLNIVLYKLSVSGFFGFGKIVWIDVSVCGVMIVVVMFCNVWLMMSVYGEFVRLYSVEVIVKLINLRKNMWLWLNRLFNCLLVISVIVYRFVYDEMMSCLVDDEVFSFVWIDGSVILMMKKFSGGRNVLMSRIENIV